MALRSTAPVIPRMAACLRAVVAAAMLAAVPAPLHAAAILASDNPADPLAPFGDRLKHGLSPAVAVALLPAPSGPGILSAVLADRERIGFAQRDGRRQAVL